jgi:Fic family protein
LSKNAYVYGMIDKVHTFEINIDWSLIALVSKIDRFDASWTSIEKREGQSLKQLKSIATVRSVGASTRIEGSKMTDQEVDILLQNLDISKLEDRDSQEVAGYFQVMDLIAESFDDIDITENNIKNLHNLLLKFSKKDEWHRGNYKQHNNAVEASLPNGTKQIIFQTTEPGFETENAMRVLIDWYQADNITHPLVKSALFAYEFLSIHPFQDGNGRLSRLISTLLLLKNGYKWIQYVSLEHEIETRKTEYYGELRKCQAQRPGENVSSWVGFFFDALTKIQEQLMAKLETKGIKSLLSPREKSILVIIENHAGIKSSHIADKLSIPNPTVKRILADMVSKNLIEKHGTGPGTNYTIK